MSNSKIIVGLDIGTTKVCAIVGRKNDHGKMDILGMGKAESTGVARGVVVNIEKTVQAIKLAVDEASRKSNVKIEVVHVGIAGQHIKSFQHRNTITRDDAETEINVEDINRLREGMHKLALPPGDEIIHVLPQDFTVDHEHGIKDPVGMSGIRLEGNFHIITGQMMAAKNIRKCVEKGGLTVADLILEPLASSTSVLDREEMQAGVCLVDIGGGTTDVAIFYDDVIRHTAVIPFGGNIITEDIKEGCSVLRNQAEQLKVKFGSAMAMENKENEIVCIPGIRGRQHKEISVRNLAMVIQARVEEIFEQVLYEIKSSGLERKLAAGIVITGGGAQLKHITHLAELVTGMDARIGYPHEHIGKGMDDVKSPMYATGIGLVMMGLDENTQDPDVQESKLQSAHKEDTESTGSFFGKLLKKGKDFMLSEDELKDFE
jgi:cell division protein FtsA